MDDMHFETVAAKVREFVAPIGFEETEKGCFKKDNTSFLIEYDEAAKTFNLKNKEVGEDGENVTNLSVWLFDETHRKKDAETIGEDFSDTIRAKLGIAKERVATSAAEVALPTRNNKKDGALTMDQFTQRFLAVYPQYKEDYKANVAENGSFMPIEFYRTRGAQKLREIAAGGNKKQLEKMLSMLNEFYCQGDRQVADSIMALFFGGAFGNNKELFASIAENLNEYPYLAGGASEIVSVASKNKKFMALFD